MDITGEYQIDATREVVWEALNNPDVLKKCIPGCQELEKSSETEMTATVVSKIGPVKATFKGSVMLENLKPPESYTIRGEGKGGVAGFAKGHADVSLKEEGGATVLSYVVAAQVGGKIAQLGSRLIDSTAKKLSDEFFSNFAKHLSPEGVETESVQVDETGMEGSSQESGQQAIERSGSDAGLEEDPERKKAFGGVTFWLIVAIAIVLVIYLLR